MSVSLDTLDFLASSAGAPLLAQLAAEDLSDANTLPLLTRLRRAYTAEQAGAALELARLRRKAVGKFGEDAARLFFTADALEQASDPLARHYRAAWVSGCRTVDACCGIGADSLAFAQAGHEVTGVDLDPVRVQMARLNAAALGARARFDVGDVREHIPSADFVFFDPARRDAQGNRLYDVERYQPPLSLIRRWQSRLIGVKLSPGVDLAQLESYAGAVEFISVDGDLKEAALWLGSEQTGMAAVLLTDEATYRWQPAALPPPSVLSEPRGWLVEPDPALIRARLVADAAAAFDGAQLDATIAYFTTDARPDSPWLRAWQIVDWMPFNLKRLRAYLREHRVGQVTVKKRGTAVTPDALIPRLKLKGEQTRTLVLTRCLERQIILICQ